MSLPPGYSVTELKNVTVAGPVCESGTSSWNTSYETGQDFQIEVTVPDSSPGVVYGLNQTVRLALWSAIYDNGSDGDIQLWRTPQSDKFDFKKRWLDSESSDPAHPNFPYYSGEAVAKSELKKEKIDGKDAYSVTLRMRKNPTVSLPREIQRKGDKSDKRTIKQFDVQEEYIITLFRQDEMEAGSKTPIAQWLWGHKHAWGSNDDGSPQFEPHPGFMWKCKQRSPLQNNYVLEGSIVTEGKPHDYFVVLDDSDRCMLDDESCATPTDEWEISHA